MLHHLSPETHYYVRVEAENAAGEITLNGEFTTTPVGPPQVYRLGGIERELGVTFGVFEAEVEGNGAETKYSYELASSPGGPWLPVSGAAGSISEAEDFARPMAHVTGLTGSTTYYIRITASNAKG